MCAKVKQEAQNPLMLRSHRLMEAFAKSDDERDFYLDRLEGFLVYIDLDKPDEELGSLEEEMMSFGDRYCLIPKLTYYETKKIMEGFVNEKVYDIDTKEKLLDIIQSKEARENFLEFIFDHHTEFEKWTQYYQERSRIRIIEWLRNNHFHFVFEEDLELPRGIIEKLKQSLFQPKVGKEIDSARKALVAKAKTYYSNEALNPRPKRGRPPKQAIKAEIEHQVITDIYISVPPKLRPFLFTPDIAQFSISTFSSKFEGSESSLTQRRMAQAAAAAELADDNIDQKLSALRTLSSRWLTDEPKKPAFDEEEELDEVEVVTPKPKRPIAKARPPAKKAAPPPKKQAPAPSKKTPAKKRIMPRAPVKKSPDKKRIMPRAPVKKSPAKKRIMPPPPSKKTPAKKPIMHPAKNQKSKPVIPQKKKAPPPKRRR